MPESSEQLLDRYVATVVKVARLAERRIPYGASIFYSAFAFISAFSVLVFLVDSLTQFAGLQLPLLIHGLVYLIPLGFALAGWHRGKVVRDVSNGA